MDQASTIISSDSVALNILTTVVYIVWPVYPIIPIPIVWQHW